MEVNISRTWLVSFLIRSYDRTKDTSLVAAPNDHTVRTSFGRHIGPLKRLYEALSDPLKSYERLHRALQSATWKEKGCFEGRHKAL